ncbi:PKD domain-containing protein [Mucilaginibacter sp.]|uniref:PKD domain-containing protein n=1 Tax=Mucilaginibacter sp. TaxID=1882438 RepID=UPI002614BDE3|nr:PKD domain-containing protein [Mucilaginibacter sp.]MDB5030867.1 type sorting protein [Mucilaginibacter sp.]
MFKYFTGIAIRKNIYAVIFISLGLFFSNKGYTQSLGDPIVNITFGSGTNKYAGPLPADSGSTSYTYSSGTPNDNFYTIVNTSSNTNGGWWITTDHTGNPGGYFMLVNGSFTPGIFYTRTVTGLCGNTKYQFAAWIKNLLKNNGILPNVTFSIETAGGTVLGTGNTNDIPTGDAWIQYPFTFTTPAGTDAIVLKMVNNAPGGIGNDIAIDDITFRAYGAQVAVVFDNPAISQSLCSGTSQMVIINTTTTLAANYNQKRQLLVDGVWTDQGPAGTNSSFSFSSPTIAGTYSYRIVSGQADNINVSNCVVSSNQLTLTVFPTPTAALLAPDNTCFGDSTAFKDKSTANVTWLWDFGDGQTSVKQNPSHLYAALGNYTVQLTVTNSNGCTAVSTPKSIHVGQAPVASFNYSTPDCVTKAVTFNDISTSADGIITARAWSYGDGITEPKVDNQAFQHIYAATGTYTVKLLITNDKGCTSTLIKTIKISPLPVVNFGTPAVCLADTYARFTDSTTIADNTVAGFTYLWDFGDNANATAANPNISNLTNPTHKYAQAKLYHVTLTVTSVNGCQVTTIKDFTVNGSTPTAIFNVLNAAALCSNRPVYFTNQSFVDIGNITKVVWYYDSGDITIQETDNNPYSGKPYQHTYPEFHTSPATRNYQVSMLAYSGVTCVSEMNKTITLLATPTVSFNAPAAVCLNAGKIQLNAQENSGIPGSGAYSGTGVSSTGLFDPASVGVGTFNIKYIFTANSTCADTISSTIMVKPIPTVNAGTAIAILAGGSTTLHATATGDGITYAWLPIIGLSNAAVPDPVVNPGQDITYTITVTNSEGCSASDKVTVSVLKSPVIPNTFTPNGDGINDVWDIKHLDAYLDCTVEVFNRYGQKVYTSVGYLMAWDGRFNNKDMPTGVYYYFINPKHGRKTMSGYVTIIR